MLFIGLMSGTSADGIDGVLIELMDNGLRIFATRSMDYSPGVKESIESIIRRYPNVDDGEIEHLDEALGVDFARTAEELIQAAGPGTAVSAIGSHGQTIYHGPGDEPPVTLQVGGPQVIADLTGVTTVGNFRANDLRTGGQGAPLAPAFHNAVFRDREVDRLIVNIGGIANLTSLPADRTRPVLGFDTGPGNTLMDQWCRVWTGLRYDIDGSWAARGELPRELVDALLADPYFSAPAPKSTGREYFHLDWMKKRYPRWRDIDPVDLQAGLLEVTALSIAQAAAGIYGTHSYEIYIGGGGAHNAALMSRLEMLAPAGVDTTDALGLSPDWVEACAFAWLAHRRIHNLPGNLPGVTGASREVLLGEIYTPTA
ncbi:MAG: Anhydro-N-acetylmuramic acid kinase [Gammaproteobacteria bacterium]|nr:Anhydro-N-acetylmuramic acid kinase [Gammaproteobacteria bacterium]